MELTIIIKTSQETFIRKLIGNEVKWWEQWLYRQLKNRDSLHIGRYKLRSGHFCEGDRDLYSIVWRLIMWRSEPINPNQNAKEVTITLDEEYEKFLYKDIAQIETGSVLIC
jgi:hypothetical protein